MRHRDAAYLRLPAIILALAAAAYAGCSVDTTGGSGDGGAARTQDASGAGDAGDAKDAGGQADGGAPALTYPIVDTAQAFCYDAKTPIVCPAPGAAFYGQDGQFLGDQPRYTLGGDGLTVHDDVTGLTWQRSPESNGDGALTAADKFTYANAITRCEDLGTARLGGFDDWRLPTI